MSESLKDSNARCRDNIWPITWDSMFLPEPSVAGDESRSRRSTKWRRLICCPCLPFCALLLLLMALLAAAALALLIYSLIAANRRTTATPIIIFVNMTTAFEQTNSSTTTTNPSTTTIYCGSSCLNRSWIDPSGILGLWRFDGSFDDATNTYNGTPSANPPTFVNGYIGQAASFNAAAQQAVYAPFIPIHGVSFTIEAWIDPTGFPNPTDASIVGLCPLQVADYCLHINIRNRRLYFGFYYNDVAGATTLTAGRWVHTSFVFDAGAMTVTIYLNGVIDGKSTVTSALLVSSGQFTIGTNEGVALPQNFFQGYMDQVSVSSRLKSSCEILEIATLAAQFKFDSPTPSADSGPNAVPTTSSSASSVASGRYNQAIAFSGSNTSYFQASGFISLAADNQPFSISFWIQPRTLSGTLVHLSSSSSGTGANCFPLLGFSSTGAIVAQVLTSSGTLATATGPVLSVSPSSWIHVAQTWSTSGLRLYVNGILVGSAGAQTFVGSGASLNYVTLGSCMGGCSTCVKGGVGVAGGYAGAMDEWRMYTRELTSEDVCTLTYAQ